MRGRLGSALYPSQESRVFGVVNFWPLMSSDRPLGLVAKETFTRFGCTSSGYRLGEAIGVCCCEPHLQVVASAGRVEALRHRSGDGQVVAGLRKVGVRVAAIVVLEDLPPKDPSGSSPSSGSVALPLSVICSPTL